MNDHLDFQGYNPPPRGASDELLVATARGKARGEYLRRYRQPLAPTRELGDSPRMDYVFVSLPATTGTVGLFDEEPLPADSPLWSAPNFIVTPQVSANDGDHCIEISLPLFFDNLRRYPDGEALHNVVRPDLGY